MLKAFLIARVSTEDQEDALPAQIYRLEDYAKRNDLKYELIQLQESAYKEGRKLFGEIVDRIEKHKEKLIVVFDKIDRFSRDSGSSETRKLRRLCRDNRIEIHFTSDHLILDSKSSANNWLMLGIGEVTAEYYSRSVSDNVCRRMEQMRRNGLITGSAPFGYVNTALKNGKKWVEIDPLKATAVKSIYEWYGTNNYSYKLVRRKLFETYAITITNSQLKRILVNTFYRGEMLYSGVYYKHYYERLISEELFELVRSVREGRFKTPTKYAGLPYPYRSLIRCSDCKCYITFEMKKGKYIYGHCTQSKGKHGAKYVEQYKFTDQLMKAFKSFEMSAEDYETVRSKVFKSLRAEDKTNTVKQAHIKTEYKKYEHRLDKLYENYADGLIPNDFYQRKFGEYTQIIQNLAKQKSTFELSDNSRFDNIDYLLNLLRDAPVIFEKADIEQKRSLMNLALSNLELNQDLLRWNLKEPFKTASICKENDNWLGVRDSNPGT